MDERALKFRFFCIFPDIDPTMDFLISFAELSLALAGIATLLMLLVDRRSHKWNEFQFTGLLAHCMIAFLFCVIPFLVNAFTADVGLISTICSAILGAQIVGQAVMVQIVDKKSTATLKLELLVLGFAAATVLSMNAGGIFFLRTLEAYYVGIIFHLVQASIIFFAFIGAALAERQQTER